MHLHFMPPFESNYSLIYRYARVPVVETLALFTSVSYLAKTVILVLGVGVNAMEESQQSLEALPGK